VVAAGRWSVPDADDVTPLATVGVMRADGPLVLWDIDGTLLRARGAGAFCFRDALAELGHAWPDDRPDFGGRTDRDIAGLLLQACHPHRLAPAAGATTALMQRVEALYAAREADYATRTEALPNAHRAVSRLADADAVQTVVTGNVASIARRKIAAVGLLDALRLDVGAFGDDHDERHVLVHLALERTTAAGHRVVADRCWIVGDTPRDLAAARAAGVRCALVATGTFDLDELAALDADLVMADLHAVDELLAAI
jgi:phosphoglycolate phosphatase-like HAD superfamily hydrolase